MRFASALRCVVSGASGTAAVLALTCCAAFAAKPLDEAAVAEAATKIVAERSKDGVYSLRDPGSGETLNLAIDEIRAVRGLPEFGWFPDIVFHDKANPKRKYTIDLWLKEDAGALKFMDARVHKDAKPDGDGFMMITRSPLLWWWLPTLKRQSAVGGIQAWQVMGRVHEHIIGLSQDGAYPLAIGDGKSVPAELVAIYQPVGRSKEDGRYFTCAELRNIGEPGAFYAVDFWVQSDARSVHAGSARPIENSRAGGGTARKESPCRFEGIAFDVVE
jgi:hypothetical protein